VTAYLHRLTQPEAQRALAAGETAILVAGSVEQHGPHLPLGTDALAALGIAERVAERLGAPIVPLGLVGIAPYHLAWPGSLTLRPRTLIDLFVDVGSGLAAAGARRLLVVNWHEGNTPTLRLAAEELQRMAETRVVIAETHVIANALFPDEMEFTHAGAMETAAVLAHDPGAVRLDAVRDATERERGERGHELFRRRDVFPVLRDFREIAPTGWYGDPARVSEARAREIADRVADHVVIRAREAWEALEEQEGR
jgi:creatinine amidohydrolase